jgi:hypothetical protein
MSNPSAKLSAIREAIRCAELSAYPDGQAEAVDCMVYAMAARQGARIDFSSREDQLTEASKHNAWQPVEKPKMTRLRQVWTARTWPRHTNANRKRGIGEICSENLCRPRSEGVHKEHTKLRTHKIKGRLLNVVRYPHPGCADDSRSDIVKIFANVAVLAKAFYLLTH